MSNYTLTTPKQKYRTFGGIRRLYKPWFSRKTKKAAQKTLQNARKNFGTRGFVEPVKDDQGRTRYMIWVRV